MNAVATAKRTLMREADAITAAAGRIDASFAGAVDLLATSGRVVVTGIGKSGVIAQKIAATLTSTGTPASYVHPVESLHGDLGIVDRTSVAILLSKSGETDELFGLLSALLEMAIPIVAITGVSDSTLGRAARFVLDASVAEEACPHDLAPTTSTTVALALGDALAMALLERKGFGREDFAALHPAGRLGRKLLLRVQDVMVPTSDSLSAESRMQDVVVGLAHGRGLVVIGTNRTVDGVITAGDLTRVAEKDTSYFALPASDVMTRNPYIAKVSDLGAVALGQLERLGIMAAPVIDDHNKLVGVVHLHDLLRAGAA